MWQKSKPARLLLALSFALVTPHARAEGEVQLKAVDPKENSPKEELRLKLFKANPAKAACAVVPTHPQQATQGLDADLDKFLKQILDALKARDDKALQPLFHPRMNVSLAAINETYSKIDSVYQAPLEFSIYRLWALNTVDGSPKGLACDDDRLTVFPQYGYPLQFGVWLQIMGQKELGRIYLSLVPADGKWNIGALHAQQWTHDSRDFASWVEDAQRVQRMGHKEAAYIKYDIAQKLLDAGGFIEMALRDDVTKARDAVMSQADWDKAVRALVKGHEVAYTSTLLVVGGGGILVRLKTDKEISGEQLKTDCRAIADEILKQPWAAYAEGVRCSFVLPREDPKQEGILGGMFLAFDGIRPKPAN